MNFLLPGFCAAAGLIALPIILHLLRLEPRKPIPFPSLRFLGREALRDSRRNRLTRWLLLLLRCLLILLLAAVFSRPFWPLAHTGHSRAVVVIVDNSFSMQAKGRRAAAAAWLAPQLGELQPPDELGVLLVGPRPTWLVLPTRDLDAARAALESLPEGFESAHYADALQLAGAALAVLPAQEKRILLAGDGQGLAWKEVNFGRPLPPGVQLAVVPIAPAPARQAAITSLVAERTGDGRLAIDAGIRGYAPADDERTVLFFAGELDAQTAPLSALGTTRSTKLGEQRIRIVGGETQRVRAVFSVPHVAAAWAIRATLDPDDLPVDDTAYAVLPSVEDATVLLAPEPSGETDYLRHALQAAHGGGLAGLKLSPLPAAGSWPVTAVALLRGGEPFRGPKRSALDAFLAAGGGAWILVDGSPEQTAWLAARGVRVTAEPAPDEDGLHLRDFALDHPLFAPFVGQSLAPLLEPAFTRGWRLDGPAVEALARWDDRGTAVAEVSTGTGRLLLTGFDATRSGSNFPLRVGFVPFVHQAAAWLAQNAQTLANRGAVSVALPVPGAGTWSVVAGPGKKASVPVEDEVIPAAPGIYEFKSVGGSSLFAVNLDPAESDLTPWPTPDAAARLDSTERAPPVPAGAQANAAVAANGVEEHDAWWWLLAAALVVLLLELGLANRTVA